MRCTGKLITKFQNSVIYLFLRFLNQGIIFDIQKFNVDNIYHLNFQNFNIVKLILFYQNIKLQNLIIKG